MPAVFVHGVPDTKHLWSPVIARIGRDDAIGLSLPGFDEPVSEGFSATKEAYVAWLITKIEALGEPVDLVGHDWGCILTLRVASIRPDLVRSWAGGSGPVNAAYEWHPLAKILQTPGEGERFLAEMTAERLARRMIEDGVPVEAAYAAAGRVDTRMKDAILTLYRSAVRVGAEWEPDLRQITAPGLILWGLHDAPCPVVNADRLRAATGAREVIKLDAGHWFPSQRPDEIACALRSHWSAVSQPVG
jgi:pimeloyl-ACP methyl ester carboxylesterase